MIYLNQAATSWPKPQEVIRAMVHTLNNLPVGQQRSSDDFSQQDSADAVRTMLCRMMEADGGRVFFTANATQAANTIIRSLTRQGGTIVTTQTEHNSILRPLWAQQNTHVQVAPCDKNGCLHLDDLEKLLALKPSALFVNHMSNVTGAVQDMEQISRLALQYDVPLYLDLSQSLGSVPVRLSAWHAAGAFFTGHKSLRGPQGIGGFWLRDDIDCQPLMYGGTGTDSAVLDYADQPAPHEVGTQNAPAIAGLLAALMKLEQIGQAQITAHETALRNRLVQALQNVPGLMIYGTSQGFYGPIVSFNVENMAAEDVAFILHHSFGIITRSGLQCAPLIHRALGTERGGVVRVSFGWQNTIEEIDQLVAALHMLAKGG